MNFIVCLKPKVAHVMQYRRDVGVFIFCQTSCRCSHFQLFPPRLPAILNFSPLALGLDTGSRVGLSVCRSNSRSVVVPQNHFGVLVVVNDD